MKGNKKNIYSLSALEARFNEHKNRHPNQKWEDIIKIIEKDQKLLKTIQYMEQTKGEPDLLEYKDRVFIVDFSLESPDRRSVCYDVEARTTRKKFPPQTSAWEL